MSHRPSAWATRRYDAMSFLEKLVHYARGQGYASANTAREVAAVLALGPHVPKLAIDVGGNVGNYTAELRRQRPDLEVHVFEPAAANVVKLAARFTGDAKITVNAAALSDKTGDATLFANRPGSNLASLTKRNLDHLDIPFDVEEKVRTLRFEDYWRDVLAGRPIDVVKIDVEGHDLTVLEGFGEAIGAVGVVQFEFGGCNIDTRSFFRDFWLFFARHGFDILRITPLGLDRVPGYHESLECFRPTNYIATRRPTR